MTFNTLLSLTTEKIVWSVRVRAQAVWKGINRKTNEFKGFNIIFIDEQSCRIHAFMSEKLCDGYALDLKEGQLYSLSNFNVHKYKGDEINRYVVGMCEKSAVTCLVSAEEPSKSRVKFKLYDGRNEAIVTFFNEFGQAFERALKEHSEEHVVIIVASAKVNKYEANQEIYLSNYPATRFYINQNHYSVSKIQKSMILGTEDKDEDATIFTVKEIKQLGKD
ncbi:hypothetical protein POM88_012078 [Heracleum sosnowskyi]|uniref:Replication protein A 70 kDa DNA-binding subunit B/D first OB fold domain-containing protein n=1 Tax=Heracleum sosnowskyi TaxID=360622 RepID=A0AAD8IVS0_9APIA|nr:hypothetical protein POM88_012078 [Heracleum sosnowskyi]